MRGLKSRGSEEARRSTAGDEVGVSADGTAGLAVGGGESECVPSPSPPAGSLARSGAEV